MTGPLYQIHQDVAIMGQISENGSDLISRYELEQLLPGMEVAQPGWRDMPAELNVRTSGGAAPTWSQMGTSPFWAYNVGVGKEWWCNFHIQHDYMPGSGIHFHAHFTTSGTQTRPIRFQVEYTIAKGHNQSNFDIASGWSTVTCEVIPHGTAWRHYVAEIVEPVSDVELEVDSIIITKFKRITNGATDNTDNCFVLFADMHYMADRTVTPNKAPNFYA